METAVATADGTLTVNAPAIATAIYKVGKTVVIKGKRYRVSRHGKVKTNNNGMKYIDIDLMPL
jgi:hypothetical protein